MLRNFVERVKRTNLSLKKKFKPSKCKNGFDRVNFLGHTLQKNSVGPQTPTTSHTQNPHEVEFSFAAL